MGFEVSTMLLREESRMLMKNLDKLEDIVCSLD
jgi:hypothetical protein